MTSQQRLDPKLFRRGLRNWRLLAMALALGAALLTLLLVATPASGVAKQVASKIAGRLTPAPDLNRQTASWTRMETAMHDLDVLRIKIGDWTDFGGGGAVEEIGENILVVTPKGRFRYLTPQGQIRALGLSLDMQNEAFEASGWLDDPTIRTYWFRSHDLFAMPAGEGEDIRLFASHHRYRADRDCVEIVLSEARIAVAGSEITPRSSAFEDVHVIDRCIQRKTGGFPFAGHQTGGRILALSDNELLMSTGDLEFDGYHAPEAVSADDGNELGKILKIDLETGTSEIVARGLRNPEGLTLASDGRVWIADNGPQGGDELDEFKMGADFGWPEVTYGFLYGYPRRPWPLNPEQGRHEGSAAYEKPAFVFMPSVAVSSVMEVNSSQFPLWRGDLLVGSLKGQTVFRLRVEDGQVIYNEPLEFEERIRDMIELKDGRIVILTDTPHLIILRDGETAGAVAGADAPVEIAGLRDVQLAQNGPPPDWPSLAERGAALFQAHCAACHEAKARVNNEGPHLVGVVGREIGSLPGYSYSARLADDRRRWTKDRLVSYLMEPEKQFSGTVMPRAGHLVPHAEWPAVVAYLDETS